MAAPRSLTKSRYGLGSSPTGTPRADVKEAIRLTGIRTFSPSGTFEVDDMDNWQECTQTCRGTVSRRSWVNVAMGDWPRRFQ